MYLLYARHIGEKQTNNYVNKQVEQYKHFLERLEKIRRTHDS